MNNVAGKTLATSSSDFASCTSDVSFYKIPLTEEPAGEKTPIPNRNLVIVDTPGFDDSHVADAVILRKISLALALLSVSFECPVPYPCANISSSGMEKAP